MPFNVLLLPLLGGYLFITNWNRTRFATKRYSGERLIFHSAAAGVALLFVAHLCVQLLVWLAPASYEGWHHTVPFSYSGTSAGAFLLGAFAWMPLNRWTHRREAETRRVITEWNDYLEVLLERAMRETKQVSVSIKNGKVYVGFITSNFDPAYERKYIRFLPTSSGYRNPADQKVVFNTNYAHVYQKIIEENNAFLLGGVDDFQIIVPVSEISSANLFDPNAYERFQTSAAA